jgi:hypothetical protein
MVGFSSYTPSPREQFYFAIVAAICLGIAGLAKLYDLGTTVSVVFGAFGVVGIVLQAWPTLEQQTAMAAQTPSTFSQSPTSTPSAPTVAASTVVTSTPGSKTSALQSALFPSLAKTQGPTLVPLDQNFG